MGEIISNFWWKRKWTEVKGDEEKKEEMPEEEQLRVKKKLQVRAILD